MNLITRKAVCTNINPVIKFSSIDHKTQKFSIAEITATLFSQFLKHVSVIEWNSSSGSTVSQQSFAARWMAAFLDYNTCQCLQCYFVLCWMRLASVQFVWHKGAASHTPYSSLKPEQWMQKSSDFSHFAVCSSRVICLELFGVWLCLTRKHSIIL